MAWEELVVESWEQFSKFMTSRIDRGVFGLTCFRGQSDSMWSLKPSLVRLIEGQPGQEARNAIQIEEQLMKRFTFLVGKNIEQLCQNTWFPSQWALMQHFNVPTRLLDWSHSPYVAAYFAVAERWDVDGAV